MIGEIVKVPAIVGGKSLIGVSKERPCSWGNYFELYNGPRVWNFWAENLETAKERFLEDGLVQIIRYDRGCIIWDARIPDDWYYNKLCMTGGPAISLEIAKEIYEILGDPDYELEQWIDPYSYWKKRGGEYIVTESGFNIVRITY